MPDLQGMLVSFFLQSDNRPVFYRDSASIFWSMVHYLFKEVWPKKSTQYQDFAFHHMGLLKKEEKLAATDAHCVDMTKPVVWQLRLKWGQTGVD